MEQSLLAFAESLTQNSPFLAYIFFFFNSVLQILFPPYPGDSVVILQGYLSSKGVLNPALHFLTTYLGTFLSSVFLYMLSHRYGHKLMENKFIKKYFNTQKVLKLDNWFKKYGVAAIIINKFIPGIASLTLIAAGIFELPVIPAIIAISISSFLHMLALFMTGRFTGNNMSFLKKFLYKNRVILIIIAIIALGVYIYIKFIYKKRNPTEE